MTPTLEAWSFHHSTAREVPSFAFLEGRFHPLLHSKLAPWQNLLLKKDEPEKQCHQPGAASLPTNPLHFLQQHPQLHWHIFKSVHIERIFSLTSFQREVQLSQGFLKISVLRSRFWFLRNPLYLKNSPRDVLVQKCKCLCRWVTPPTLPEKAADAQNSFLSAKVSPFNWLG